MDELLKSIERHRNTFVAIGVLLVGGFLVALGFSFNNPSDILQAMATLLGSALSGGVAAVVAIIILKREERAREIERQDSRASALVAIQGWIDTLTDRVTRETMIVARFFPSNDQNQIVTTMNVLLGLKISDILQSQITKINTELLYEMLKANETIERFTQPLARSGATREYYPGSWAFVTPLNPEDIRTIAILPDEFAKILLKCGRIELDLEKSCLAAARQLFKATDASIQIARNENGVVFNNDHWRFRPDWYDPT